MSCYEWEAGTITLPTAAAKPFRDTIKKAVDAYKARMYNAAQEFWKALPAKAKRDEQTYRKYASAWCWGNNPRDKYSYDKDVPNYPGIRGITDWNTYGNDVHQLLGRVLHHYEQKTIGTRPDGTAITTRAWVENKPRRVTQKDVDTAIGKATGTKFRISCGEPGFTIEGRKVHWDVPSNNHACEHAREHPLAEVLFRALDRVHWTRGSGGTIVGNNEYNQDYESAGSGGNYIVTQYGPRS